MVVRRPLVPLLQRKLVDAATEFRRNLLADSSNIMCCSALSDITHMPEQLCVARLYASYSCNDTSHKRSLPLEHVLG
jgi:hypothetical protein